MPVRGEVTDPLQVLSDWLRWRINQKDLEPIQLFEEDAEGQPRSVLREIAEGVYRSFRVPTMWLLDANKRVEETLSRQGEHRPVHFPPRVGQFDSAGYADPSWVRVIDYDAPIYEADEQTGRTPLPLACRFQESGSREKFTYDEFLRCVVTCYVYGPTRRAIAALDKRIYHLLTRADRIVVDYELVDGETGLPPIAGDEIVSRVVTAELHSVNSQGGRDTYDPPDEGNPRPVRLHSYVVRFYEHYQEEMD